MKLLITLFAFIPTLIFSQSETKKVVMILSSYGKDMGKTRPGFEMDEFSQAYLIFKANGLKIVVASPKGGKVESGNFNKEKPYNKAVLNDSEALILLGNTKPTATLQAKEYDAVYIVGGKGPMFDLVVDPALQDFILEMNAKNAIISSVCHGTIAFANIKDGTSYFIKNKSVTGYSNHEETMFGKTASEFPFLLEDKLLSSGAKYDKLKPMLPFMLKDGNLITGQNPYSTTLVVEEIIKALGLTPILRQKYKDRTSNVFVKSEMLYITLLI